MKKFAKILVDAEVFSRHLTNICNPYFENAGIEISGVAFKQKIEVPQKAAQLAYLFDLIKN